MLYLFIALCTPAAMNPTISDGGAHLPLTPTETGTFLISLPLYGSHPCLCFLSSHETYLSPSPFLLLTEKLRFYPFSCIYLKLPPRPHPPTNIVPRKGEEENTEMQPLTGVYSPSYMGFKISTTALVFQAFYYVLHTIKIAKHGKIKIWAHTSFSST